MKPARFLTVMLILIVSASVAFAAGTPANTKITNQATGTYKDASNNDYNASSNIVQTSVARVAGVVINPDTGASNLVANSFVLYSTTVKNNGNYADDIGLAAVVDGSPTGTYTVEIYEDVDGDGVIDAGVDLIVTSTDSIAADAEFDVILKVTEASGDDTFELGEVFSVTLTGTGHGGVTDTGTFTSTVIGADIQVDIDVDITSPDPGTTLTYTVCLDNTNGTDAAYDVTVNIPLDADLIFVAGSIWYGGTGHGNGTNPTDNIDGDDGQFDSNTVTVFLGDIAAGSSACVYFQATVNPAATPGTDITLDPDVDHDNDPDGPGTPYDDDDPDDSGDGVSITVPSYYNPIVAIVGDDSTGGYPNDEIVFTFTVTNDGNTSDIFDFTINSDESWSWVIYVDDGNGSWDGSGTDLAAGANTGSMAVDQVITYHIVVNIPDATADGVVDDLEVVATSQGDGSNDNAIFETTVTAPLLSLVKSVSPTGSQPPGTELTYTVIISNSGSVPATTIVISDNIPLNTTYVAGSLEIDSVSKTDEGPTHPTSPDSDGAQCDGTTAQFDFSSIGDGSSNTVSFKVTID